MLPAEATVPRRSTRWLLAAVPAVAAVAPYVGVFPGELTAQDAFLVERSAQLADPKRVLLDPFASNRLEPDFRPLQLLTYSVQVRAGASASGFRAASVAINACVAIVAYLVLLELLGDAVLAALAAALFAALPIRSEAVAAVLARGELLGALAILAVWWIALRSSRPGAVERPGAILAAGSITFLGLLAGGIPVAVVPFAILASGAILRRRVPPWVLASSASAVLGYLALRAVALQGRVVPVSALENPLGGSSSIIRALNGARLAGLYVWKSVAPLQLSVDYSYPQIVARGWLDLFAWLAAVGSIVALVLAVIAVRRALPIVALAAAFFALAIVPFLNVLRIESAAFAERFAATAAFAIPLAAAALVAKASAVRLRRVGVGILVVLVVAAAGRTWLRSLDWASAAAMEARVAEQPSRKVRELYGKVERALAEKRHAEGIQTTEELLRLLVDLRVPEIEPGIFLFRAEFQLGLGRDAQALSDYDRHLAAMARLGRQPTGMTLSQRGLVLGKLGRLQEALAAFDAALAIAQDLPQAWNNRGFCRYKLGYYLGAVEDYWRGAQLCRTLGLLHAKQGDSSFAFLLRISDVYEEAARRHDAEGSPEKAGMARELSASHRAQAASLAPSR